MTGGLDDISYRLGRLEEQAKAGERSRAINREKQDQILERLASLDTKLSPLVGVVPDIEKRVGKLEATDQRRKGALSAVAGMASIVTVGVVEGLRALFRSHG